MQPAFLKKFFIVTLGFLLIVLNIPLLSADEDTSQTGDVIDMIVGDIKTVPVNNLTRVSLTNPGIADISDAQSDKISLLAKKSGETVLFLWDAGGERNVKIRVVNEDLEAVKARVQKMLNEANITGLSLEENMDIGKVVVSGSLSKEDKSLMDNILEPYSDDLFSLVKEEKSEDLIQVDMQVVEISTTLEKELGIEWGAATSGTAGTTGGSSGNTNSGSVLLNYNETLPTFNGKIGDFFKVGNFARTSPLEATVNALVKEGKARLISKPRLVVVSGKEASFLVGGEIPVNTTTTNTTGSTLTQNTTYTQYGVNMTVTPTIREGKIDVKLNVDIRDIDSSNSSNGNVAFITRTAQTDLRLDNNQTIALAGLIKYEDSVQITSVPFFSKIPILGALFRNRSEPGDTNTEMVIILTPTVLTDKKYAASQLVMPTPEVRDSYKEIDSKYEHERLPDWPAAKVDTQSISTEDIPSVTAYARMVQEKISNAILYPSGMGYDFTGTVRLKLHILRDGSLDTEEVIESSGNNVLDQDAMQAAKAASPYGVFSTEMDQEDLVFTVPIVYNRLNPGDQSPPAEKVIASY